MRKCVNSSIYLIRASPLSYTIYICAFYLATATLLFLQVMSRSSPLTSGEQKYLEKVRSSLKNAKIEPIKRNKKNFNNWKFLILNNIKSNKLLSAFNFFAKDKNYDDDNHFCEKNAIEDLPAQTQLLKLEKELKEKRCQDYLGNKLDSKGTLVPLPEREKELRSQLNDIIITYLAENIGSDHLYILHNIPRHAPLYWAEICATCELKGQFAIREYHNQLSSLKLSACKGFEEFVFKLNTARAELTKLGEKQSDARLTSSLIQGMDTPEVRYIRRHLEKEEGKTFDSLVNMAKRLINNKRQRDQEKTTSSHKTQAVLQTILDEETESDPDVKTKVKRKRIPRKPKKNNLYNHKFVVYNPQYNDRGRRRPRGRGFGRGRGRGRRGRSYHRRYENNVHIKRYGGYFNGTCNHCGKRGHKERFCTNKKENNSRIRAYQIKALTSTLDKLQHENLHDDGSSDNTQP